MPRVRRTTILVYNPTQAWHCLEREQNLRVSYKCIKTAPEAVILK